MSNDQNNVTGSSSEMAGQPEPGSFVTGFTVGLFAGAAGYFLFATKRGATLRQTLETEWKSAQAHLLTKGAIEQSSVDLRAAVSRWWQEYVAQPTTKKSSTSTVAKKTRKPVQKKFKGV